MKKTLVMGASENRSRYAYRAIELLKAHGHEVIPFGKYPGTISGIPIETEKKAFDQIDTLTLYINPATQKEYYDYIISLKPKRIIFNPGTENVELEQLAQQHGIETLRACTLVLLSTHQY
jgi:predicted CoA-binding protein